MRECKEAEESSHGPCKDGHRLKVHLLAPGELGDELRISVSARHDSYVGSKGFQREGEKKGLPEAAGRESVV